MSIKKMSHTYKKRLKTWKRQGKRKQIQIMIKVIRKRENDAYMNGIINALTHLND